jgi:D-galactarolactone cycloisomerase
VRAPLSRPRGPSILTYHERASLFLKLTTDEGLVGWGETYLLGGAEALIRDTLGPLLLGRSPFELRSLHRELLSASFHNGFAVAAIDIALHDLLGKALGVPVHQLYGGALRSQLPVYASMPGYFDDCGPEEHWLSETTELIERGFRAMKLRIGRFPPSRELPIIARVRQSLPDGVRLMADANAAYSMTSALRVGSALADIGLDWFEEPLPQQGYHGYPELRQKLRLPLAGGEGLQTRAGFSTLLARNAVDIVQPDVSICGGIAECLFVGELAALSGVACVPHCWAGAITLAATLHVVALLPDASRMPGAEPPLVELDVTENPFRDAISNTSFEPVDGHLPLPTGPGLGIEIDESLVRRYGAQSG